MYMYIVIVLLTDVTHSSLQLCIPAMYLLLIIYSITNLNVVSWGTREVAVKKTKKEMEEERKAAEANLKSAKKTGGTAGLWAFLQRQQEEASAS